MIDIVTDHRNGEYDMFGEKVPDMCLCFPSIKGLIAVCGIAAVYLLIVFYAGIVYAASVPWWELDQTEQHLLRHDDTNGKWKNWRQEREIRRKARNSVKRLILRSEENNLQEHRHVKTNLQHCFSNIKVWVKDSRGAVSDVTPIREKECIVVYVPHDLELNGRYILGSQFTTSHVGDDSEQDAGRTCFCAKTCVLHMKRGGKLQNKTGFFFDDPLRIPLEIGPLITLGKSPYAGVFQEEHGVQVMQVRYNGKPLASAYLTVATENGWVREYITGEDGTCTVIPIEDRSDEQIWQRYHYETSYVDQTTGIHYLASLTTIVCDCRHKWRSMFLGVTVLSVSTAVLMLGGGVAVYFYRRKKRASLPAVIKDCCVIRGDEK